MAVQPEEATAYYHGRRCVCTAVTAFCRRRNGVHATGMCLEPSQGPALTNRSCRSSQDYGAELSGFTLHSSGLKIAHSDTRFNKISLCPIQFLSSFNALT